MLIVLWYTFITYVIYSLPIQWSAPTQPCDCFEVSNPVHWVGHRNSCQQKAKLGTSRRSFVRSNKLSGKICSEVDALILTGHIFMWSSVDFIIWAFIHHCVRAFLHFRSKQEHKVWIISNVSAFKADCYGVMPVGKKKIKNLLIVTFPIEIKPWRLFVTTWILKVL